MVISSIKKRFNKWLNHRKLEGQDMTHGEMVKKFGYFQLELEASIGCKAWKKSGLIQDNNYDCEENSDSVREETASDEIVLELYEIPSSSQIVTNQLTELDLNKSQTESLELNETKVLKQKSITSYFCKIFSIFLILYFCIFNKAQLKCTTPKIVIFQKKRNLSVRLNKSTT